jgi:hypothetical protein
MAVFAGLGIGATDRSLLHRCVQSLGDDAMERLDISSENVAAPVEYVIGRQPRLRRLRSE